MGLDIYAGMLYGTTSDKIFEYTRERVEVPLYDYRTGKLTSEKRFEYVEKVTFLVDIFEWKTGETVSYEDWMTKLEFIQEEYQNKGEEFKFIYSDTSSYFGFNLNENEPTYNSPQDWVDEFVLDLDAINKWDNMFPNIPAKKYIYVRASY